MENQVGDISEKGPSALLTGDRQKVLNNFILQKFLSRIIKFCRPSNFNPTLKLVIFI